jgi:hypothetical protein
MLPISDLTFVDGNKLTGYSRAGYHRLIDSSRESHVNCADSFPPILLCYTLQGGGGFIDLFGGEAGRKSAISLSRRGER